MLFNKNSVIIIIAIIVLAIFTFFFYNVDIFTIIYCEGDTISEMSKAALKEFDVYSNNGGYDIYRLSKLIELLKDLSYELAYGRVNGVSQYYIHLSDNRNIVFNAKCTIKPGLYNDLVCLN